MYFCTMAKVKKILYSTFSVLLLIHILSCNMHVGYYINLISNNTLYSKDFEAGEDQSNESKTNEGNSSDDSLDDYYSVLFFSNNITSPASIDSISKKSNFQHSIQSFPKVDYEIQSPPPEVLI
jgi:hypothetical protein